MNLFIEAKIPSIWSLALDLSPAFQFYLTDQASLFDKVPLFRPIDENLHWESDTQKIEILFVDFFQLEADLTKVHFVVF